MQTRPIEITPRELETLRVRFQPLIGLCIDWFSIPSPALPGFEPSQMAVIVNTILDAALPQIEMLATNPENLERLKEIGLRKAPRLIGEREGYPDYMHTSGYRVELKGLFVDNAELGLKRPPTKREPSARLKDNVTVTVVDPAKDTLMVVAVQPQIIEKAICRPVVVDVEVFSMIECIRARDQRLLATGRWLGGTIPQVVKKTSRSKFLAGEVLTDADYEKDTNFGKLKRIPYPPLQAFMRKHGAI